MSKPPSVIDARLAELAALGRTCEYSRGSYLLREGEQSDTLVIILKGRVRVLSATDDGRQVVIDEHGPGQYVGEMAIDGQPRSASVQAMTDCAASVVAKDTLLRFLREHPDFALDLILRLVHRVRLATENFKGLALLNVYGRVVRLLQSLARSSAEGTLQIDDLPTQADIAQRVGASREMVSILMRDLAEGGYIEKHGRQLVIKKPLPQRW